MRVLIVDPSELSAGMLALVLEIYGHQVRLIRGPETASRVAGDFHPDIVLLTVSAPVTPSESVAASELRSATDGDLQIFALCATPANLSDREQCLFDRVFSRPVRFGQLKPFLEAPINRSRMVGETVRSA